LQNQRKHVRFRLRLIDIESKLSQVGSVDIVDMSLGGVLLRAEGKLAIGKQCSIQFIFRGRNYPVKGIVVRSELCGIDEQSRAKPVNLYLIGVMFKEESAGPVEELLNSIEQSKKVEVPASANWRFRDIKFNLTMPNEEILEFPTQFVIQDISKSGIIIRIDQQLKPDSLLLLELSIGGAEPASFMGRVVSCRRTRDGSGEGYVVGVEFSALTDRAFTFLHEFVESMKNNGA
jgi:hypothetical protein